MTPHRKNTVKDSAQTMQIEYVISVDAMGGDKGPEAVVLGLSHAAERDAQIRFLLHGDKHTLAPLLSCHPHLTGRVHVVHTDKAVTMDDKPAQIMRRGKGTSMWATIESVKTGAAHAAVSCGNTGALMALSILLLRTIEGVNRPAIACLWPSLNAGGFNVMLDVGAGIEAEAEDLLHFAAMGAAYARNGLALECPRVGLLNVGTEEHKGRSALKDAYSQMENAAKTSGYDFVGFVEGVDIPSTRVDVIVTDGFTGNVALKTGEGTAKLISTILRETFSASLITKLAAALMIGPLRKLRNRMDPRRINGGVFLGLNGTIVKSHGSSDATGVAAAIELAIRLARSDFVTQVSKGINVTRPIDNTQQEANT